MSLPPLRRVPAAGVRLLSRTLGATAMSCLPALTMVGPAQANEALANKNGCLGCHAKATKIVGPSYAEVAAKYAGEADAAAQLAQRIRVGGSGRWGDIAMPPQMQLKEADARKLALWILAGAK